MGYDLYIHRRANWWDKGDDIEQSAWESLCADDLSLELTGVAIGRNPATDEVIEIKQDGLAQWSGDQQTWFNLHKGHIIVSGSEEAIIAKACQIATSLSARVQGDEGEFYREDGSHYND
ncbi:MAG: hypothetical protein HEQ22_06970 [Sphingopyxis sp.]|uniref:hypothetical protein n=1 Tax=Sphingopyxis sp. TaxID=1908224 RepID=UPI003D80E161